MPNSKFLCYGQTTAPEYTLCGDAFDLCEGDDEDAKTPRFAKPGQKITCPDCIRQIRDIQENISANLRFNKNVKDIPFIAKRDMAEPTPKEQK